MSIFISFLCISCLRESLYKGGKMDWCVYFWIPGTLYCRMCLLTCGIWIVVYGMYCHLFLVAQYLDKCSVSCCTWSVLDIFVVIIELYHFVVEMLCGQC